MSAANSRAPDDLLDLPQNPLRQASGFDAVRSAHRYEGTADK